MMVYPRHANGEMWELERCVRSNLNWIVMCNVHLIGMGGMEMTLRLKWLGVC